MANAECRSRISNVHSILRSSVEAGNVLQRRVRSERHRNFWLLGLRGEVLAGIDEAIRLELVLLVVERLVAAAEGDQLGVRAALDDLAAFEDEDLIGAAD